MEVETRIREFIREQSGLTCAQLRERGFTMRCHGCEGCVSLLDSLSCPPQMTLERLSRMLTEWAATDTRELLRPADCPPEYFVTGIAGIEIVRADRRDATIRFTCDIGGTPLSIQVPVCVRFVFDTYDGESVEVSSDSATVSCGDTWPGVCESLREVQGIFQAADGECPLCAHPTCHSGDPRAQ